MAEASSYLMLYDAIVLVATTTACTAQGQHKHFGPKVVQHMAHGINCKNVNYLLDCVEQFYYLFTLIASQG